MFCFLITFVREIQIYVTDLSSNNMSPFMKRRESVIVFSRRLSKAILPKKAAVGMSAELGGHAGASEVGQAINPGRRALLLTDLERSHSLDDRRLADQLARRKVSFGKRLKIIMTACFDVAKCSSEARSVEREH